MHTGIFIESYPCQSVSLELNIRLSEVLPVRRLAVAVQFYLRAHDRGYSVDAAIKEMRSALAELTQRESNLDPDPDPASNVIDMESARERLQKLKVLVIEHKAQQL